MNFNQSIVSNWTYCMRYCSSTYLCICTVIVRYSIKGYLKKGSSVYWEKRRRRIWGNNIFPDKTFFFQFCHLMDSARNMEYDNGTMAYVKCHRRMGNCPIAVLFSRKTRSWRCDAYNYELMHLRVSIIHESKRLVQAFTNHSWMGGRIHRARWIDVSVLMWSEVN